MGEEWTDVLAEEISKQFELSCSLRLSYINQCNFCRVLCRECDLVLELYTPRKSGTTTIQIPSEFKVFSDESKHFKNFRRKIRGSKRIKCAESLEGKKPIQVLEKMILDRQTTNIDKTFILSLLKLQFVMSIQK